MCAWYSFVNKLYSFTNLTSRRSNQSILKEISPGVHWKDWCWSWNSNTLATSCKELTHLKRLWCWEGLGAGGEGDERRWDGWMASPTQWTWVWVDSWSWWWTGRPGVLRFMGLQSRTPLSDWTELNKSDNWIKSLHYLPVLGKWESSYICLYYSHIASTRTFGVITNKNTAGAFEQVLENMN